MTEATAATIMLHCDYADACAVRAEGCSEIWYGSGDQPVAASIIDRRGVWALQMMRSTRSM